MMHSLHEYEVQDSVIEKKKNVYVAFFLFCTFSVTKAKTHTGSMYGTCTCIVIQTYIHLYIQGTWTPVYMYCACTSVARFYL